MLLGVDAGGTSTRAVLVDSGGACIGYGVAGGGNPIAWGPELAAQAVVASVAAALEQGRSLGLVPASPQRDGPEVSLPPSPPGLVPAPPGGGPLAPERAGGEAVLPGSAGGGAVLPGRAVLAMAGGSAAAPTGLFESGLAALGLPVEVILESDLLATFCAGTAEPDGYAVVAGTGASAIRVADGRVDGTADGLGWLLGDAGSGFWIGHRVVRAALAFLDGRGPATALSDLLLRELGIPNGSGPARGGRPDAVQRATEALYRDRPVAVSRFAALAFAAAKDGDPVASRILRDAEKSLVETLSAVRRPGRTGPVVLGGGIARRLSGLPEAIRGLFAGAPPAGGPSQGAVTVGSASGDCGVAAPDVVTVGSASGDCGVAAPPVTVGSASGDGDAAAPDVVTVTDGAVGAAVLALRHAGVTVDRAVFDRLTTTVARLR